MRIVLKDVSYTYGDGTKAVDGIDLAVGRGEFLGILGYNGSGKTTRRTGTGLSAHRDDDRLPGGAKSVG